MTSKANLSDSIKELSAIVRWFDEQKEVDVEAGLEKVKQGAELIKFCRERLKSVENEFVEIEKQMGGDLAGI